MQKEIIKTAKNSNESICDDLCIYGKNTGFSCNRIGGCGAVYHLDYYASGDKFIKEPENSENEL